MSYFRGWWHVPILISGWLKAVGAGIKREASPAAGEAASAQPGEN